MATGARYLLRADDAPDNAASVGYDAREVRLVRAAAYNRERTTDMLLKTDVVFHAE
jgi:hypothetical protein